MKSYLISLLLMLICCGGIFAQETIKIDFDNDGILDKANLISNVGNYKIEFSISSLGGKTQYSQTITCGGQQNFLTVTKNVLKVNSQYMRGENYFKFRYDAKRKKIVLIGYDNDQYGNAMHEGSGNSSLNLVMGLCIAKWHYYDLDKQDLIAYPINKKVPVKVYTLQEFSDITIRTLDEMCYKLLPKKLR